MRVTRPNAVFAVLSLLLILSVLPLARNTREGRRKERAGLRRGGACLTCGRLGSCSPLFLEFLELLHPHLHGENQEEEGRIGQARMSAICEGRPKCTRDVMQAGLQVFHLKKSASACVYEWCGPL